MTSLSKRPWSGWDEIHETENKVIKGAFEQNYGYFEPKISKILKHTHISGNINKFENAFMKLIIDDQVDDKPLKYVEQYIIKNRGKANILPEIAKDFKFLVLTLLERSVENEKCDSL